ncbi:nucleoside deaminase [Halorubrum sp. DTA98]|uniref:nucleoside deaminase n=1 Tax=Halorubrum sp. DTA98 TaxID=3402163 RepID=UPI003AB07DD8
MTESPAVEDATHVDRAIELAREAVDDGNTPFGSLLVVDGDVVRESRNTTRSDDDITAHPELKLARWAARELDADERENCTMYTSTEPCSMCASAIVYAGLDRVVFSVRGRSLATLSDGVIDIPCEEVVRRGDGDTTVDGPVNEAAGLRVHETFFGD